jgi:glycosyltransferase involved in cell wall biosynthesis
MSPMSVRAPSLSIIVPAFNEARVIRRTLEQLRTHLRDTVSDWEVRVVDDGSSDDTRSIVSDCATRDPRIVLQAGPHRGKGGAVRAGMLAAKADLRFMCDADLSMPLEELPRFLEAVTARCDIAIAAREGVGAHRVDEPVFRHAMGRAFNGLVRMMGLTDVDDTQCGFKLFSARAAEAVFRRITLEGWAFDIEALFIAQRLGYRVEVIPIEWHYRERSRVRPVRDSLGMAAEVARVRFNAWNGKYR